MKCFGHVTIGGGHEKDGICWKECIFRLGVGVPLENLKEVAEKMEIREGLSPLMNTTVYTRKKIDG